MKCPGAEKFAFAGEVLDTLASRFAVVPMGEHATAIEAARSLPVAAR